MLQRQRLLLCVLKVELIKWVEPQVQGLWQQRGIKGVYMQCTSCRCCRQLALPARLHCLI